MDDLELESLSKRLEAAAKKREAVSSEVQKLTGKLESAQKSLESIEEEIRKKGIDPEDLPRTIEKLSDKYKLLVEEVEAEVAAAESALSPFLKEK